MNSQFSEILSELEQKRIQDEFAEIRLEEEALKGKTFVSRSLAMLGNWMVKNGQKLRARHEAALQSKGSKLGDGMAVR